MAWLRMNIKNEKTTGELEMDQTTNENTEAVISGFFGVFGSVSAVPTIVVQESQALVNSTIKSAETVRTIQKEVATEKMVERTTQPTVSRKIPALLNSDRTLSTNVGEEVKKAFDTAAIQTGDEPDWYKTGIKHKDGVPHYRCRYWCKNPECRNKGSHYIKEDETSVSCHNCGEQLEVRPAGTNYPFERDEWGNFFVADQPIQG